MKALITEINEKIKEIINELTERKIELETSLESVRSKIDDKVEEARKYKEQVDKAKDDIKLYEDEIDGLNDKLDGLKERFSSEEFETILDTGKREISNLISQKESKINDRKKTIGELTAKAHTIKDLLVNLKKDKETKSETLENIDKCLEYYKNEFDKIIDYSSSNYDNLSYNSSYSKEYDDSPVFDEIEDTYQKEEKEEEIKYDPNDNVFDTITDDTFEDEDVNNSFDELNDSSELEEDNYSLFEHDKTQKIDFKTLNDTIDKEYENIFGNSIESEELETTHNNKMKEETNSYNSSENIFDNRGESSIDELLSINSDNSLVLNNTQDNTSGNVFDNSPIEDTTTIQANDQNVSNFFSSKNIDFFNFSQADQSMINQRFDEDNFKKVFEVLERNNIDYSNVYNACNVLFVDSANLESIISKLLLAGQTTQNIGLVLNSLAFVTPDDVSEVINSYGDLIKTANITDIIIKAKHLKDMGGAK